LGANQLISRAAIFELGGSKYALIVDTADYGGAGDNSADIGGDWRIAKFGGNLSNFLSVDRMLKLPVILRDSINNIFTHGVIPFTYVSDIFDELEFDFETYLYGIR